MKSAPSSPDPLEVFVARALRELPPTLAPASLAERVFAEIHRLDALPWWKKSFAYWPVGIRKMFFLISAIAAGLVMAALFALMTRVPEVAVAGGMTARFPLLGVGREVFGSFTGVVVRDLQEIPKFWLYGGVAAIATAYAFVIGAGAAAYRHFKISR